MDINSTGDMKKHTMLHVHQIMEGKTWHVRHLPSKHSFDYPYRYWGLSLKRLVQEDYAVSNYLFSCRSRKAIHSVVFSDYCDTTKLDTSLTDIDKDATDSNKKSFSKKQEPVTAQDWLTAIEKELLQQTNSIPSGDIVALVVSRNFGRYFSPVNFYIGYSESGQPSHLLAEVSNTPWNKSRFYGFLLTDKVTTFSHDKNFHVSPFNPIDQQYHWQVRLKPRTHSQQVTGQCDTSAVNKEITLHDVSITIKVTDERGEVFSAGVNLKARPLTHKTIKASILRNLAMNYSSMARIYWHAMLLFVKKKVPYIDYNQKLQDSQQRMKKHTTDTPLKSNKHIKKLSNIFKKNHEQ